MVKPNPGVPWSSGVWAIAVGVAGGDRAREKGSRFEEQEGYIKKSRPPIQAPGLARGHGLRQGWSAGWPQKIVRDRGAEQTDRISSPQQHRGAIRWLPHTR